jgi:hypothetical protein
LKAKKEVQKVFSDINLPERPVRQASSNSYLKNSLDTSLEKLEKEAQEGKVEDPTKQLLKYI